MRILVVDDDIKIANAITKGLKQQSYAVDVAYDGDSALALATSEPYNLLILDRMIPGSLDGMGILQRIRELGDATPVLFLTAKDKILDRAEGLNAGADDYLVKPFSFVELIARVRALLRRPINAVTTKISYEDLELDTIERTVMRSNQKIDLTAKEYALLEFLVRNSERTFSKDKIVENIWNFDSSILPNTVEVYIGYLRKKIDKSFPNLPSLIKTRRGFGYYVGVK